MKKNKNKDVRRNSGDLFTIRLEQDGVKYWLLTACNNECDPVADCGDCFFNWIPPSGDSEEGRCVRTEEEEKRTGPCYSERDGYLKFLLAQRGSILKTSRKDWMRRLHNMSSKALGETFRKPGETIDFECPSGKIVRLVAVSTGRANRCDGCYFYWKPSRDYGMGRCVRLWGDVERTGSCVSKESDYVIFREVIPEGESEEKRL